MEASTHDRRCTVTRAEAQRTVIAAAKAWRATACRPDAVLSEIADAHDALVGAIDKLAKVESAGPTTLDELSCRAANGFYNADLESLAQLFARGRRWMAQRKNVGRVYLAEYESVLRANGFDVDDWSSR